MTLNPRFARGFAACTLSVVLFACSDGDATHRDPQSGAVHTPATSSAPPASNAPPAAPAPTPPEGPSSSSDSANPIGSVATEGGVCEPNAVCNGVASCVESCRKQADGRCCL